MNIKTSKAGVFARPVNEQPAPAEAAQMIAAKGAELSPESMRLADILWRTGPMTSPELSAICLATGMDIGKAYEGVECQFSGLPNDAEYIYRFGWRVCVSAWEPTAFEESRIVRAAWWHARILRDFAVDMHRKEDHLAAHVAWQMSEFCKAGEEDADRVADAINGRVWGELGPWFAKALQRKDYEAAARWYVRRFYLCVNDESDALPVYRPTGDTVYLMHCPAWGLLKIGYTSRAAYERLREIQMETGEGVHLVATIRGGRSDEKALHEMFRRLRVRGEWFKDAPEIRAAFGLSAKRGAA